MNRLLAVLALMWPAVLFAEESKYIATAFFENRKVVEALLSENECVSLTNRIKKLGPQTATITPFDKSKPAVTGKLTKLWCTSTSGTKKIDSKSY